MQYETLRYFADSWGLLALTLIFIGVVLWVTRRPGSRNLYREQAEIPFKHDREND